MQLTSIVSILAVAMTAAAVPATNVAPRTDGDDNDCNSESANVCCPGGVLSSILCSVTVLGNNCEGSSYCCETDDSEGGLVNINLLNCVKLL